eukprot:COSAG01_NODE_937_length_12628_cov_12.665257_5_plen_398_part_00
MRESLRRRATASQGVTGDGGGGGARTWLSRPSTSYAPSVADSGTLRRLRASFRRVRGGPAGVRFKAAGPDGCGAAVVAVEPHTAAARQGVRAGMVLRCIGEREASRLDFERLLSLMGIPRVASEVGAGDGDGGAGEGGATHNGHTPLNLEFELVEANPEPKTGAPSPTAASAAATAAAAAEAELDGFNPRGVRTVSGGVGSSANQSQGDFPSTKPTTAPPSPPPPPPQQQQAQQQAQEKEWRRRRQRQPRQLGAPVGSVRAAAAPSLLSRPASAAAAGRQRGGGALLSSANPNQQSISDVSIYDGGGGAPVSADSVSALAPSWEAQHAALVRFYRTQCMVKSDAELAAVLHRRSAAAARAAGVPPPPASSRLALPAHAWERLCHALELKYGVAPVRL